MVYVVNIRVFNLIIVIHSNTPVANYSVHAPRSYNIGTNRHNTHQVHDIHRVHPQKNLCCCHHITTVLIHHTRFVYCNTNISKVWRDLVATTTLQYRTIICKIPSSVLYKKLMPSSTTLNRWNGLLELSFLRLLSSSTQEKLTTLMTSLTFNGDCPSLYRGRFLQTQ